MRPEDPEIAVELALYQPDIPQNAGTLIRLSACLAFTLHVIHPAGFGITDSRLRRSTLDYGASAEIVQHDSFDIFHGWCRKNRRRLVLLITGAERSGYAFAFEAGDVLMVGRESGGVPDSVRARADAAIRIPMRPAMRSLNVAVAAAMMIGEALRQTGEWETMA